MMTTAKLATRDYFGEVSAVPEATPSQTAWAAEKKATEAAELRRCLVDADRRLGNLGNEFLDRVLEAGNLPRDEASRRRLGDHLRGVSAGVSFFAPIDLTVGPNYQSALKLATEAEALAAKIADRMYLGADFHVGMLVDLPDRLRDYARAIRPSQALIALERHHKNAGRRQRVEDKIVFRALAVAFHDLGGRVANSRNGPFARFLMVAWEALPEDRRPKSPEALVHHTRSLARRGKKSPIEQAN